MRFLTRPFLFGLLTAILALGTLGCGDDTKNRPPPVPEGSAPPLASDNKIQVPPPPKGPPGKQQQ